MGFDAVVLRLGFGLGVHQIMVVLDVQPELRGITQVFFQAQRRVGADAAPRLDDLVDPRDRHADGLGRRVGRDAHGLEKFLKQNLAGVGRRDVNDLGVLGGHGGCSYWGLLALNGNP